MRIYAKNIPTKLIPYKVTEPSYRLCLKRSPKQEQQEQQEKAE